MAQQRNLKPSDLAFHERNAFTAVVKTTVPVSKGPPKSVLAPFMTSVSTDFQTAFPNPEAIWDPDKPAPEHDQRFSSFPHLTHEGKGRAAHVTSARFVTTVPGPNGSTVNVLERFHQDDKPGAKPHRDRFIGADEETGVVYGVTASFKKTGHIPSKFTKDKAVLDRGAPLNSELFEHLDFNLGGVDEKSPPLSPRSRHRAVPDKGYT